MKKQVVILADRNFEQYLMMLQLKFVEEKSDEVELVVITDQAYYQEYFSMPRSAGVLIVDSSWYEPDIHRHTLAHVFVLGEKSSKSDRAVFINKYSSAKDIYNEVVSLSPDVFRRASQQRGTQVVAVSSAMGGIGKTAVALALSKCLAENYKRVLYLDAEEIQNFHFFLSDRSELPPSAVRIFSHADSQMLQELTPYLKTESFSYIPPLSVALSSAGAETAVYLRLIEQAKASGAYDFIVVDSGSVLDAFQSQLYAAADRVLLLTGQDAYCAFQTRRYLANLNHRDVEKYLLVCNRFRKGIPNELVSAACTLPVTEYIEAQTAENCGLQELSKADGLRKLSYMLT